MRQSLRRGRGSAVKRKSFGGLFPQLVVLGDDPRTLGGIPRRHVGRFCVEEMLVVRETVLSLPDGSML